MITRRNAILPTMVAVLTLTLTGCGGGGSSSDSGSSSSSSSSSTSSSGGASATVTYHITAKTSSDVGVVAFQDGASGTWAAVAPTSSSTDGTTGLISYTYELTVTDSDGKYGVAAVCNKSGGGYTGDMLQATADEVTARWLNCSENSATESGSLSNYNASTDTYTFLAGDHAKLPTGMADYTVSGPGAPGSYTLVAVDRNTGGADPNMVIQRNVSLDYSNKTLPTLDFTNQFLANGGDFTITATNIPSSYHAAFSTYSLRVDRTKVGYLYTQGSSTSLTYASLPSAKLGSNDRYEYNTYVDDATHKDQRFAYGYTRSPVDASYPTPAAAPTPSMGTAGNRLSYSFDAWDSGVSGQETNVYRFHLFDKNNDGEWDVRQTAAWLGSSSQYTYTFPDLSSVSGWVTKYTPTTPSGSATYGTDYKDFFAAGTTSTTGTSEWDLVAGYNNGLMPVTEGTWYASASVGPF